MEWYVITVIYIYLICVCVIVCDVSKKLWPQTTHNIIQYVIMLL